MHVHKVAWGRDSGRVGRLGRVINVTRAMGTTKGNKSNGKTKGNKSNGNNEG
jgi:hypothetical protein